MRKLIVTIAAFAIFGFAFASATPVNPLQAAGGQVDNPIADILGPCAPGTLSSTGYVFELAGVEIGKLFSCSPDGSWSEIKEGFRFAEDHCMSWIGSCGGTNYAGKVWLSFDECVADVETWSNDCKSVARGFLENPAYTGPYGCAATSEPVNYGGCE